MRGVAEETDLAFAVVGVCGEVVEEGPDVWFLHKTEEFPDAFAPVLEVVEHVFHAHCFDPLIVFPFTVGFGAEDDDVHGFALFDGEGEDVAMISHVCPGNISDCLSDW